MQAAAASGRVPDGGNGRDAAVKLSLNVRTAEQRQRQWQRQRRSRSRTRRGSVSALSCISDLQRQLTAASFRLEDAKVGIEDLDKALDDTDKEVKKRQSIASRQSHVDQRRCVAVSPPSTWRCAVYGCVFSRPGEGVTCRLWSAGRKCGEGYGCWNPVGSGCACKSGSSAQPMSRLGRCVVRLPVVVLAV